MGRGRVRCPLRPRGSLSYDRATQAGAPSKNVAPRLKSGVAPRGLFEDGCSRRGALSRPEPILGNDKRWLVCEMPAPFTNNELQAIARALGDTDLGFTGSEITDLIFQCGFPDEFATETKWKRLHKTLWNAQCRCGDRRPVLAFIRKAMQPARHLRDPHRFEEMRQALNTALALCGLAVDEDGTLRAATRVTTIPEAERRARELRGILQSRGIHPDVLTFCRAELVADNYFHAVLEASKSVADKLRKLTGLDLDGAELIDRALGGSTPLLAINSLQSQSERSEQKGFVNLLKGVHGMFRNPTAHEARIVWKMDRADAEDLMATLSLAHRRLDKVRRNIFGGKL